jgi:hypothetical protein
VHHGVGLLDCSEAWAYLGWRPAVKAERKKNGAACGAVLFAKKVAAFWKKRRKNLVKLAVLVSPSQAPPNKSFLRHFFQKSSYFLGPT